MTTVEVLQKARELYAAAPSHASVDDFPDPGTVCVMTALDKACQRIKSGYSSAAFQAANSAFERALDSEEVVKFNATHSTADVLAVFDKAIEAVAA